MAAFDNYESRVFGTAGKRIGVAQWSGIHVQDSFKEKLLVSITSTY
jgi:hypothetical protein